MLKILDKIIRKLGYVSAYEHRLCLLELESERKKYKALSDIKTEPIVKAIQGARMVTIMYEEPRATWVAHDLIPIHAPIEQYKRPPGPHQWYAIRLGIDAGVVNRVYTDVGDSKEVEFFIQTLLNKIGYEIYALMKIAK